MSQRDVPEWFSFYVYEFMGDERVIGMTLEQVGAYVLLLIGQWINGSIPGDVPALARLLKRTTAEMEILWAGVGPCFTSHPTEPGRMVQKRLEEERGVTLERMKTERERQKKIRAEKKRKHATNEVRTEDEHFSCTVLSSSNTKNPLEEEKRSAEFAALYPAHRLDNYGAQLFTSSTPETQAEILAGLRLWVKAEAWTESGGKFVNKASRFITEKVYERKPQMPEEVESKYQRYEG